MTSGEALILGVVQGITEFFPVSSSGHLILLPRLFGWQQQPLAFDAVLHLGTGLAVLLYFWRDWRKMFQAALSDIRDSRFTIQDLRLGNCKFSSPARQLVLIAIASIPAGLAGLLFNEWVETNLRAPAIVAGALLVVALLMLFADNHRAVKDLVLDNALVIGFSQVLALIPGVSRSGITMVAGRFGGLTRREAARFSFLLSTPIVLAAGLWGLSEIGQLTTSYLLLAIGFLFSFLTGLLAIKLFLRLLERWGLLPFAVYRILLALLILVVLFWESPFLPV